MTSQILRDIWLVPGHDHRGVQRAAGRRTRLNRLPLGEKGLGRFAVHKLGNKIELVTRRKGEPECLLMLDWEALASHEFLEDARVEILERTPVIFQGDSSGTSIKVSDLRGEAWTRGEARRLARQITSISSPFRDRSDDFKAILKVPENPLWVDNLPDIASLLNLAPWRFNFKLEVNTFSWSYEYVGVPGTGASTRSESGAREGVVINAADLQSSRGELDPLGRPSKTKEVVTDPEFQEGIGVIAGTFYVFDRDREVLARMGDNQALKSFLDEHGGVRVYRDGIRVYNYGEPSDDWLGLELRRINFPSKRISRNIVLGSIDLDLGSSTGLIEKTNREGFVENETFSRLRAAVLGIIAQFENERFKDKEILRRILKSAKTASGESIEVPLKAMRRIAVRHNLVDEFDPLIHKAEKSYRDMREIMLRSGISNMTLIVVFHEIEHGVKLLHKSITSGVPVEKLIPQTKELLGLLDGFSELLRKGDAKDNHLSTLISRAVKLNRVRLRNHDIELVLGELDPDKTIVANYPLGLVLGAVTNLIDNSVFWLKTKYPSATFGPDNRALYLGLDNSNFSGPALVVADNGPGFQDSLDELTRPFFSRRPEGIGIGLYYVNLIMELSGGSLVMLDGEDVGLPDRFDGAALALVFKKVRQ